MYYILRYVNCRNVVEFYLKEAFIDTLIIYLSSLDYTLKECELFANRLRLCVFSKPNVWPVFTYIYHFLARWVYNSLITCIKNTNTNPIYHELDIIIRKRDFDYNSGVMYDKRIVVDIKMVCMFIYRILPHRQLKYPAITPSNS